MTTTTTTTKLFAGFTLEQLDDATPGPWAVAPNGFCVFTTTTKTGAGVAHCGMNARSPEESKRNARLVAAAPEIRDELKRVLQDNQRQRDIILSLMAAEQRSLHCAFCGEAYPEGTPASKHERLAAHIRECPEHPIARELAEAKAEIERLNAPRWWYDADDWEACFDDPEDIIDYQQPSAGAVLKLGRLRALPPEFVTVIEDERGGLDYRESTPEEIARYEAESAEHKRKARRLPEVDR